MAGWGSPRSRGRSWQQLESSLIDATQCQLQVPVLVLPLQAASAPDIACLRLFLGILVSLRAVFYILSFCPGAILCCEFVSLPRARAPSDVMSACKSRPRRPVSGPPRLHILSPVLLVDQLMPIYEDSPTASARLERANSVPPAFALMPYSVRSLLRDSHGRLQAVTMVSPDWLSRCLWR